VELMSSTVAVVELYVVFRLAICQSVKQCEDKFGRAAWGLYWRDEACRYGFIRALQVEKYLGD
jgi:hypothetical protein